MRLGLSPSQGPSPWILEASAYNLCIPGPISLWDFATGLEKSQAYDAVVVVVDRLSKMRHCIPCRADCFSAAAAKFFVDQV